MTFGVVLSIKWWNILGPTIWDPGSTVVWKDLNMLQQLNFELEDKFKMEEGSNTTEAGNQGIIFCIYF